MKQQIIIFLCLCSMLLCSCESVNSNSLTRDNNTKTANYNVELGLRYLEKGDRQRAKQKLLKAFAQAPQIAATNDALAYYFEATGVLTEATYYYKQAMMLAPGKGAPLNNYAAFLCRHSHFTEADALFRKAVRDPSYLNTAAAYENAGLCALAIPNIEAAKNYFKTALAQDPRRERSRVELRRL